ncbi:MAG: hypothetical protein J5772_03105, partial [Clostridia bacterium]|nr:hypothetical protein [Clostridia bacterium]
MKKTFIVLSLCLILCLAACTKAGGGAEPTAVQQDDSSFVNKFGDGYAKLIETDDAFYYSFMSGYLYYYDKANGVSGVLCSKPECIHDAKKQNNG